MNTNTPDADRFEDRLLTAILDDFDNLTAPASSARPSPLPGSASHRGQVRRIVPAMVATAAAAAVAVAGVAVADGHGHATPRVAAQPGRQVTKSGGPVMELASYRLRLPINYRLTAAATSECPVLGVGFVSPNPGKGGTTASTAQVPEYASQIATAASADGGCIAMVLAPPYTPTATDPDPEAGTFEITPPVQVGPYEGHVGTWTSYAKPSNVATQQAGLYVEIPVAGGQTQDLAVTANNLSESALVSLVANGLSVGGSSSAQRTTSPN